MRMRPQLQMRQTQALVMTPQLQMAIRLLQLSRLDLLEEVRQELEDNPVLEETAAPQEAETVSLEAPEEGPEEGVQDGPARERGEAEQEPYLPPPGTSDHTQEVGLRDLPEDLGSWREYLDSGQAPPSDFPEEVERPSFEASATRAESLQEHLAWQLRMSDLSPAEMEVGESVIGNLDEDGYLRAPLEEVLRPGPGGEELLETGRKVLSRIQELDPPGVGARDLAECLTIQLAQLGHGPDSLPARLVARHLDDLGRGDLAHAARALGAPLAEVEAAARVVRALEPKPGRPFGGETSSYVTPDVFITKVSGEWTITLNEEGIPRLGVSSFYRELVRGGKSLAPEAREFLQERFRSANWLIKSIDQRQRTIYKVARSILDQQRDFFDKGVQHLRPLVLRDVAEDIGVHESTVSRVTTQKYLSCPHGLFELKYFFNPGISTSSGEMLASESVRAKIRDFIRDEKPDDPLSDQAIAEMLRAGAGIDIARRTVAKYREAMGIPTSGQRKKRAARPA